jgi:hypothetical protein
MGCKALDKGSGFQVSHETRRGEAVIARGGRLTNPALGSGRSTLITAAAFIALFGVVIDA